MLVTNTDVLSKFLLVIIFKLFLYKASEKEKVMKLLPPRKSKHIVTQMSEY